MHLENLENPESSGKVARGQEIFISNKLRQFRIMSKFVLQARNDNGTV